ncbi:MAG: tRNA 2-selenouridine(34) synthase MnmH [Saprospiraceae bacterium]|nr:tRNA 2-selenouridine(34) synthase MnmH [Saprospiraceae bacterium]
MQHQAVKDFLSNSDEHPIIDVRSPAEFEKGHIPGAHNIPLFSNDERAQIGKTYKHQGKDLAVKEGLKIVGPRMAAMVDQIENINPGKDLRIYCWRGGMRSSSVAWLFETSGYRCTLLEGGYKSYRGLMSSIFEELDIILIGGETGSGKTEVLQELKKLGEQTIDLEDLANHKGSAFGSVGMPEQPSNEHFQNLVIEEFLKLDPKTRIFVEDESANIGKVFLPEELWLKMKGSPVIQLSIDLEARVNRLVKDYGNNDKEELKSCILKIERKLGGQNVKAAIEHLGSGDLVSVARLLLYYYDKSYRFQLERKKSRIISRIESEEGHPKTLAVNIINKMGSEVLHGSN